MINVDISNIWGEVKLSDLLGIEKEVFEAHKTLTEGTGAGSDALGWLNLPLRENSKELSRIQDAAQRIREESDVCVVVGIGAACLGARAVIELLQGPERNLTKKAGSPLILFAGNSLSTRSWNELVWSLEGKDFSVIVVSKSGTTTEPAVVFRGLRWMLERRYGTDEANSRIYAVTDPCSGALYHMAQDLGWERFSIPPTVTGRFSVLTAAGLLPMAVAGIDILALMNGAMDGKETYDLRSFENPVWLYAAVRNLLYRTGKKIELISCFEPGFRRFGDWWQRLFAATEGKDGKGIFPVGAEYTADLHTLGQMVQQGERNLFETLVRFDPPALEMVIDSDVTNLDGLNYLAGRTLDDVQEQAYAGTLAAHADGGVSVVTVDCGELTDRKVGELVYFLELSCGISGYILGVNPFNQPGVERYKRNMFQLLGKPGYEK